MKLTNPYVKNEIDYKPHEKTYCGVMKLDGVILDYAVALATGYKEVLTECKQGGKWIGFDIVDNAISPFWRCVEGYREGRGKLPMIRGWYQPTQDSDMLLELIRTEQIDIKFDYKSSQITASYNGEYETSGYDLYNVVCRCIVYKNIGDIVQVPIVLTKKISTEYTLED